MNGERVCHWCTYPATALSSYGLPGGALYCNPECAAAHIFEGRIGGHLTRYAQLCQTVGIRNQLKLAPPREALQKYGGTLTIDEYRAKSKDYKIDVKVYEHPIVPVQKKVVEEVEVDYTKKVHRYIPINDSRVDDAVKALVLQRKKRIDTDTLEAWIARDT
jgi:hypothetical protein